MALDVFIVAGEASADLHAAALLKELQQIYPGMKCFGVGGKELEAAGAEIILPSEKLNVVGASDWFDSIGEVIGGYRRVVRQIKQRRPDVAILLDLPDFNLRLAKKLKALGVPVAYYISPQVWAWRKYRIKRIKRDVDLMLVLFPFEKEFYTKQGIEVHFVGHPLLESLRAREKYRSANEIKKAPRLALLPGSRKSEVRFHAPILKELIKQLRRRYPNIEIRVPVASTLSLEFIKESFAPFEIEYAEDSRSTLEWADVAAVASGTATLETALIGTPFCLFYRVARSSAGLFRFFVRYRGFIGMPNLLQRKEVAKEFFQEAASSENIYHEIVRIIEEDFYRLQMTQDLLDCRLKLGNTGASRRVAYQIHHLLSSYKTGLTPKQPMKLEDVAVTT